MSATEITLAGTVRPTAVLWGALRVIGTTLIATIALILLFASLAPGGIRADAQSPAAGATAGLFFRAARDDRVLEAPTLMTDVRIAVTGLISRVTVRQLFFNPSDSLM